MGAAVSVLVVVLNFIGSILPKLPNFLNELDGHDDLTPEGQAALSLIKSNLEADNDRLQKLQPVTFSPAPTPPDVPPPAPTAPASPSALHLEATPIAPVIAEPEKPAPAPVNDPANEPA